jgi:hypothetical protein
MAGVTVSGVTLGCFSKQCQVLGIMPKAEVMINGEMTWKHKAAVTGDPRYFRTLHEHLN